MKKQNHFTIMYLLPLLLLNFMVVSLNEKKIKVRLDDYLSDSKHDKTKLRTVLESGSMDGHFKSQELYDLFFYLQKQYPEYVTSEKIGTTVEKRKIYAFKLNKPNANKKLVQKSKMLFTGAHHARELLTATIVLKIFVESLHSLIYDSEKSSFWIFNDLIIVPLVNLDSHTFISKAFGTSNWDDHKYKRKNMNRKYCS